MKNKSDNGYGDGGTFRRIKTPRYATPTAAQQTNIVTAKLCPVCHERRPVRAGRIAPHQRSRDDRGLAIWPAVWCAGAGRKALAAGAGAGVMARESER